MTTEEFRRLSGLELDREKDVIQQCREVAKRCGCVLEEVGQRRPKGSGTSIGFPDLTLAVAGWWVPIEGKHKAEPSEGQIIAARWRLEEGVDTARVTSGQDLSDVIGFCMKHPRAGFRIPHSLVDYADAKGR
jgi:hypothetical protein